MSAGRLLLQQRLPTQPSPLLWETPGGKVDPTDLTDRAALARELSEEIGCTVPLNVLVPAFAPVHLWLGARKDRETPSHRVQFFEVTAALTPQPKMLQGMGWFDVDSFTALARVDAVVHSNRAAADDIARFISSRSWRR